MAKQEGPSKTKPKTYPGDKAMRDGLAAKRAGRVKEAFEHYERALSTYRQTDNQERIVLTLVNRGALEQHTGNLEQARATFSEALKMSQALGDLQRQAVCEGNLAATYLEEGKDEEAEPLLLEALKRYEALEDLSGIGNQLGNLGMLYQNRGDYPRALHHLERGAKVFVEGGNGGGAAAVLRIIGEIYRRIGEVAVSEDAFERALVLSRQIKDVQGEAYARRAIGQIRLAAGALEVATSQLKAALKLHEQTGDNRGISAAHVDLGQALAARGEVDQGLKHLRKAVELCGTRATGNDAKASALIALGALLNQVGDYQEGIEKLTEAIHIYQELANPHGYAVGAVNRATALITAGRWAEAQADLDLVEEKVDAFQLAPMAPAVWALRAQLNQLGGNMEAALEGFGQAAEGFATYERLRLEASAVVSHSIIAAELGVISDEVYQRLIAVHRHAEENKNEGLIAEVQQAMAELARIKGDFDDADKHFTTAIQILRPLKNPAAIAGALLNRGELALRRDPWDEEEFVHLERAREDLNEAFELALRHRLEPRLALTQLWLGELARRDGEARTAEDHLHEGLERAELIGYRMGIAIYHHLSARLHHQARKAQAFAAAFDKAQDLYEAMSAQQHLFELLEDFKMFPEDEE